MFRDLRNKVLLFIEPCLSLEHFVHKAQMKGYKTFIISANDSYLTLPNKNFMGTCAFFQVDTQDDEAVLNLVTQLAQKFNIEGVIPGYEGYGPLTAKIATYLKKPGLRSEIALKVERKDILQALSQNSYTGEVGMDEQEYHIKGLVKNRIVRIFIFTENLVFPESNFIDLGYIVRSKIDQIHFKKINNYLQDVVSALKLDYGFFNATVKMSEKSISLSNFTMGFAKDFMPTLIHYATGIDYSDRVFELFSNQPVSFHRTKKLNAGIIFFYKKPMKKQNLASYISELEQNPVVLEAKEYRREHGCTQHLSAKTQKIGHAILVHQDYKILKQHIKEIGKKGGVIL